MVASGSGLREIHAVPQRATAFGTVSANRPEMGWREATGGRHAVDGDNGPALIAAHILGCTYLCTGTERVGRGTNIRIPFLTMS